MGSAPTAPDQLPFETWLIPVFMVGTFVCVALIAFLKLFFTYGCSCGRRLDSVSGSEEEARLPARSVLRKEHPGITQAHVRRTIVRSIFWGNGSDFHPHFRSSFRSQTILLCTNTIRICNGHISIKKRTIPRSLPICIFKHNHLNTDQNRLCTSNKSTNNHTRNQCL
jgi:hypothetical protein